MGKSYRKRFEGNEAEIIRDVELFGRGYAMERWHCNDLLSFQRWLVEQGQDAHFGTNPQFGLSTGRNLGDQLVEALASYIVRKEAEIKRLNERSSLLEWQLAEKRIENCQKVVGLLEALKT